jgi:hypothetical protein
VSGAFRKSFLIEKLDGTSLSREDLLTHSVTGTYFGFILDDLWAMEVY